MNDTATDRGGQKISSSGAMFKKVLQALVNGDLPYSDVQSDLQRLFTAGASPDELREVLHRYESNEPLPAYARGEIVRILDAAAERAAALKLEADAAGARPADEPAPATVSTAAVTEIRAAERSPEAVSAEIRAAAPAAVSSVSTASRPAPRLAVRGGEPAPPPAENVSSIEDRIARQRADYKALTLAYERARDAGAAAAARTVALTAELAALRSALESEQARSRTLDKALSESTASAEADRSRGVETRRELEHERMELRSASNALATRDATIEQLRQAIGERDGRLAALQKDLESRAASLDAPEPVRPQLESELQAAREKSAALGKELADARAAMESFERELEEAQEALTEQVASAEAARVGREEDLRAAERATVELSSVRAALAERDAALERARHVLAERDAAIGEAGIAIAGRDAAVTEARRSLAEREVQLAALQREHARTVAALESRTTISAQLDADLEMARARAVAAASDLASARASLESERNKSRELQKQLADKAAADHARTQGDDSQREDVQRKLEAYKAELSKARDLLAARQQEHAKLVAELEARTKALEARLQAARAPEAERPWDPQANHAVTVAIEPLPERAAAPVAMAGQPARAPVAAGVRFDAGEGAPLAAADSLHPTRTPEFPLFGSRGPWKKFAVAGAALAAIAAVVWTFTHHSPAPQALRGATPAAVPAPGTVIRDCPACPAFTVVPAGRFKQGSDRTDGPTAAFERPLHWVLIGQPFAISTNAVTVDEFRAFVAATGRDMRGCDIYEDRWHDRPDGSWENPGFPQTGSHPVTCVSWDDARAYAAWLSATTGNRYRLPSAAEWEYAARAGGEAVPPWNTDRAGACANANVADQRAGRRYPGWSVFGCDDGYVYTSPVGSFKANAFGLNDMLGNVFQWTEDCWHADYTGVPVDGSARKYGDCSERELRGGSWYTAPDLVRAGYRNHFRSGYRASSLGIRLVREIAS